MIVPMKKFTFLVYHSEYVDFLEVLRELGVLHVHYQQVEPSESLQEEMDRRKNVRSALRELRHREVETRPEDRCESADGFEIVEKHEELTARLDKLQQKQNALQKELEFWRPWGRFSTESIRRLEEAGLSVRFFTCPVKKFRNEWKNDYPLEVINQLPPDVYFVVITTQGASVDVDAEEIPPPEYSPAELDEQQQRLEQQLAGIDAQLDHFAAVCLPLLETALDEIEKTIQLIEVVEHTRKEAEGKVMLIEGFAPAKREEEITGFFADQDVAIITKKPTPDDPPPVLLKNTRFSRLFEPIGKLFALPSYWELDLTPFFAPFFMMFFGFCLGDAGYGLILLLGAAIYKRRADKKLIPILSLAQFLGGATILFGLLTGTFFGMNLLEEQYAYLGDIREFMLNSDQTFQLALILGMVQIFFGLLIKAVNQIRQYGFLYSVATFGWMLLLLSLLDLGFLKQMAPISTYTAWGGVGLILLFNDPKAGLLGRLGKGIWELYGITGIFGDLLSYIRLFALGISSAILGFVVNDIALQIRDGMAVIGPVFFVLFLLIGHGLNLLIASLGAFVHPMRLTFVEFYKNAGFSGGGKAYTPFSVNEKK